MPDVMRSAKRFVRGHTTLIGSVLSVKTDAPQIVLTYDDGPMDDGPAPDLDRGELTRLVLDAYAERGLSGCSLSDALAVGSLNRGAWFSR